MRNALLRYRGLQTAARAATMALLAMAALVVLAGCGGGGGGGNPSGGTATVTGRILRAETGAASPSTATITIGGLVITAAADGAFSQTGVNAGATTAVIASAGAQSHTITIALTPNTTNNLGDQYLSDTGYTANATGTVLRQDTNAPVGGATVVIGGSKTTTNTNGTFEIDNLAVGLGTLVNVSIGTVTATGFDTKDIVPQFALAAGANPLGNILIAQPSGTVPLPPYTITGKVLSGTTAASGATVTLISITTANGNVSRGNTTTDANGNYFFWVVPQATGETYQIQVIFNGTSHSANVPAFTVNNPATVPNITF